MILIWKKDDYKIVAYKTGRYTALYKGEPLFEAFDLTYTKRLINKIMLNPERYKHEYSALRDSLTPNEQKVYAKHIINCSTDKELKDGVYELVDFDKKLFNKALDIYEREGSVSYKSKKISDSLLSTSIKDSGWYSIEHITVESVNDITLKNIVNTVKKVVRTEVKKIINGALENNILTLQVYAKNDMTKKFTWMELPLEVNLDVKRYYKGNKFDNITYYKDMSAIKNKLKTYTNKTLYEAKSLITDKAVKDSWSMTSEDYIIEHLDREGIPYRLGYEGGFQFKKWDDFKMAEEIICMIVGENYWTDKETLTIYIEE